MEKNPAGLDVRQAVAGILVPLVTGVQTFALPIVPATAFSSTALAVASPSLGVVTSNSLTSFTWMVKVSAFKDPSADVAVTSMSTLAQIGRASCRERM